MTPPKERQSRGPPAAGSCRWCTWVGVVVAAAVAALLAATAHETVEVNDATRAAWGGTYVRVSSGYTHYNLTYTTSPSPAQGVAVLVHGGSIPGFVFDVLTPHLLASGCHVLTYDRFGVGRSDRPNTRYTLAKFVSQLSHTLDLVLPEPDVPLHLVGYSFGAPIATELVAQFPSRFASLSLLAPVVHYRRPAVRLFALPVVGPWIIRLAMPMVTRRAVNTVDQLQADGVVDPGAAQRYKARWLEQVTAVGFVLAFHRMCAQSLQTDYRPLYERYQAVAGSVPTQVIWGDHDDEIPGADMADLTTIVDHSAFHVVEGAGHGLALDHAPEVAHHLVHMWRGMSQGQQQ